MLDNLCGYLFYFTFLRTLPRILYIIFIKRVLNRLANEKSPYLFQHAYNPVVGSRGAMEKESFEDTKLVEILNGILSWLKWIGGTPGRVWARYWKGEAAHLGYIDDYAPSHSKN